MSIVRFTGFAVLMAVLFLFPPFADAEERPGSMDVTLICEDQIRLSGEAKFILDQLEGGDSLQLLLYKHDDTSDFTAISLSHSGGQLKKGTHPVGVGTAITGSMMKSSAGDLLSGSVDSGELIIHQSGKGILAGTLNILSELKGQDDDRPPVRCAGRGSFTAAQGFPADLPKFPPGLLKQTSPEDLPPGPGLENDPIVANQPGSTPQGCPKGPNPGNWDMTVGKMTVMGVFTPLGGGATTGMVRTQNSGSKITADFAGVGQLVFETFSGGFEPLKGRVYQATKLPPAFSDGIYWYLSCDSPTSMLSTSGIKESHRRGGPPHVQFHRWKAK